MAPGEDVVVRDAGKFCWAQQAEDRPACTWAGAQRFSKKVSFGHCLIRSKLSAS